MLRIKRLGDVVGRSVYTSEGDLFGEIQEVNVVDNKIDGWKIKVGGSLMNLIGGARGVVIPHQFVKAIGDVFIINKASLPFKDDDVVDMASGSDGDLSADAEELF